MMAVTIDTINGFRVLKVYQGDKTTYRVVSSESTSNDNGWEFNNLLEAIQFIENEWLCLVTIAPDGDDGAKKYYVCPNEKVAINKIMKYLKNTSLLHLNYSEIPEPLYECGAMRIGEKGFICYEEYRLGDVIGEKTTNKYLEYIDSMK